jgi:hypothetical protein
MMTHGKVEVQLHVFLISVLDEDKCQLHSMAALSPEEEPQYPFYRS